MMMAACYANYDMSHQQQHALHMHHQDQQHNQQQSRISSVAAVLAAAAASATIIPQNDYNIPLHVDCSVEYELPNQPKPPAGERIEPLLMIHPCYFRKMESQRRSPFINNMPNSSRTNVILNGNNNTSSRRITRQSIITQQQQQHQDQNQRQQQQQQQQQQRYHSHHHVHSNSQHHHSLILGQQIQNQMSQMSQQAHYPVVTNIPKHQPSSSSSSAASTSTSSLDYTEQNIRRNSIIQNRSTTNNNNNNQKLTNWDKNSNSIVTVTSLTQQQTNSLNGVQPVETVNLSGKTIYSKSVGKRDAMISGGCISNINNNNNNSNNKIIDQHNNNNNNHNLNRNIKINNNNSTGCISLTSADSTNLKLWETSNTIINRSPMATVPSNYQAGPETTLTPINNNNNININNTCRNDDKINGKYRQYLRLHRNHPYIITTAKTINGHIYNQQLSTSSVTASFSQLQQMSCYNA